MSYPGVASFSVTATNYGRNAPDSYYALAGSSGGIPPGPVEITGTLTVDGNATFKQGVTCEAAVEIQGALTGAAATFSGPVSASAITSAGTGTFGGGVTAPTIIAATGLGSQGGLTVAGNVVIQNSSGVNMSGGTITGAGSVQADELFTTGKVRFGKLTTTTLGTLSDPIVSGGQLANAGVLQLTYDTQTLQYAGIFIAPDGAANNPTFLTTARCSNGSAVLGPTFVSYLANPPNINMTVGVATSNGVAGGTLDMCYLIIGRQATPS